MDLAIGLSAFGLMTVGYADNVSPGLQIAAELRSAKDDNDFFRMGLEIRGLLPTRATARESPIPGDTKPVDPSKWGVADVSQVTALAVPCLRWRYLLGCGAFEAGFLMSYGGPSGLLSTWTFSLGPRLGLEIPFAERFAVRAFGEALFVPVSSGYAQLAAATSPGVVDALWSRPVVSGFFGVGLSVRFQ